MSQKTTQKNLNLFRSDPKIQFLIADQSIEEGQNLQFVKGIVMYDLPWDPMRIEQRIGRLDRIDREQDISCRVILSHEDETLALDTAWFEILEKGFGIFNYSISDLQFLTEKEITRLKHIAFEGGPAALADESSQVASTVQKEREISDEQDIIDGLHLGEILDSPLWKNLQKTEEKAEVFRHRLTGYLYGSLGIETRINNGILSFRRGRKDPLVPTDLLMPLYGHIRPSTVSRLLAIQNKKLQFLRTGNPFIEGIREILDWDERGRAYAMWRQTNGFHDPVIVFRVNLVSELDLAKVKDTLGQMELDQFSSQSILRLISGWFPVLTFEHFIDAAGHDVDSGLIVVCQQTYSNSDINLAGKRSPVLNEIVGQKKWPRLCQNAAQKAINRVREDSDFIQKKKRAIELAQKHFNITRSRLTARRHRSIEHIESVDQALEQEGELLDIVIGVVEEPLITVDAIGAYILSEASVWKEE
jgi:ATP-dependent helicase HepA